MGDVANSVLLLVYRLSLDHALFAMTLATLALAVMLLLADVYSGNLFACHEMFSCSVDCLGQKERRLEPSSALAATCSAQPGGGYALIDSFYRYT